ncbi:hypothetical protein HYX16_02580 [Candidatus Woesearchaeota archaeon]|nr:hypothetical protein [Candidatus Woesearchaeota archaeon]
MEIRKDILILVSILLLYLAFLTLNSNVKNVEGTENINLTQGYDDLPPELCKPVYVDRSLILENQSVLKRCVKIGIPDMVFFDKACGELNLSNTTLDLCPEY